MKITIYELLGMIKSGKAPRNIKYDDMIWEYDGDYYSSKNNIILEEYCNLTTSLKDEVEIIDENNKVTQKHKIEGLGYEILSDSDNWCRLTGENYSITDYEINPYILYTINRNNRRIQKKFDEILDYLEVNNEHTISK